MSKPYEESKPILRQPRFTALSEEDRDWLAGQFGTRFREQMPPEISAHMGDDDELSAAAQLHLHLSYTLDSLGYSTPDDIRAFDLTALENDTILLDKSLALIKQHFLYETSHPQALPLDDIEALAESLARNLGIEAYQTHQAMADDETEKLPASIALALSARFKRAIDTPPYRINEEPEEEAAPVAASPTLQEEFEEIMCDAFSSAGYGIAEDAKIDFTPLYRKHSLAPELTLMPTFDLAYAWHLQGVDKPLPTLVIQKLQPLAQELGLRLEEPLQQIAAENAELAAPEKDSPKR